LSIPGEYEISAIIPYDQGKSRAESNTVRIKIAPSTPKGLDMAYVQGGWATLLYGTCVNVTSDPPEILRYGFGVMPSGGVMDASIVCKGGLRIAPVIAAPHHGTVAHNHWIGWIDKEAFWFTHFDPYQGALAPRKWDHGGVEAQIVAPLLNGASDTTDRPAGSAMIWVGDPTANASGFQIVQLAAPGEATPGGRATITGLKPSWMMNHFRRNGSRVVSYAQPSPSGFALFALPWPDQALASNPLKKLAEYKSQFVAGSALIGRDDTIMGASLILTVGTGSRKLEMLRWTLDVKNNYAEKERQEVPWQYSTPLTKSIVKVSPGGLGAALLADNLGKWSVFSNGKLIELPADLANTKMPIDLAFLNEVQPVLIVGQELRGFKIVQLSGQPLPKDPR